MKTDRLIAAFAFLLALSFSAVFAQTKPAAPAQAPAQSGVTVPESKIALIYSDAFLDAKTGIARFNTLVTTLNREFQPRQTELQGMQQRITTLTNEVQQAQAASAVVDPKDILKAREVINDIYIDDKVKEYIVDLVCATREPEQYKIQVKDFIQLGASPRATINLALAAKAYAFLKGRGYVTPQDVKSIGMDVLRHRVAITYEAEAEDKTSEIIIQKIFDELPVP